MDPISDMFIRIKNASHAGHDMVRIPYSRFKYEIVKTLERLGFITKIERKGKRVRKFLELKIVPQSAGYKGIKDVKFISKPSRRIYSSYRELALQRPRGAVILTTPKGIMSIDEARKLKVGGELIAEVW